MSRHYDLSGKEELCHPLPDERSERGLFSSNADGEIESWFQTKSCPVNPMRIVQNSNPTPRTQFSSRGYLYEPVRKRAPCGRRSKGSSPRHPNSGRRE